MPADPKRLQVANRIVEILKEITAGDDFFLTPRQVTKGFIRQADAFPVYMVFTVPGGSIVFSGENQYDETFRIEIRGIIQETTDLVTPLEYAIRDIRKAINDDSKNPLPGSLADLCVWVRIPEPPEPEYDTEKFLFGYFTQPIDIQISGDFGML